MTANEEYFRNLEAAAIAFHRAAFELDVDAMAAPAEFLWGPWSTPEGRAMVIEVLEGLQHFVDAGPIRGNGYCR